MSAKKIAGTAEELARRMYAEGAIDREIAAQIGCDTTAVYQWRKRNGMASNGKVIAHVLKQKPRGYRRNPAEHPLAARVAELHAAGQTEQEIAKALGISRSTVQRWRAMRRPEDWAPPPQQKLVEALAGGELADQIKALYEEGLSDRGIGQRLGTHKNVAQKWRKIHGLPPNNRPSVSLIVGDLERQAFKLYRAGFSEHRIAAALGCNQTTVNKWRRQNGLAPIRHVHYEPATSDRPPHRKPLISGEVEKRALKLYEAGKYDEEIAAALKCVRPKTVANWRRANGLPAHSRTYTAGRNPAWKNPLWARVAKAVGNRIEPALADEAISEMVLAVLEGRLAEEDIEREATRYRSKAVGQWASRWGPASLDADLAEDFTLLDVLVDRSQESNYRLVELSALATKIGINVRGVLEGSLS